LLDAKGRTIANLSSWPAEKIEQLRAVLRCERLLPAAQAIEIIRVLPHGHVLAALGTAYRIDIESFLPLRAPPRRRDLAQALIIAGCSMWPPSLPPRGCWIPRPPAIRWGRCWASAGSASCGEHAVA